MGVVFRVAINKDKPEIKIRYLPRGGKPLTAVEEEDLLTFLEDSVLELETESVSFIILLPVAASLV